MGFFNKKKNADVSSSTLSESEIQKKLYGEFSDRHANVVMGDREPSQAPMPFVSKEIAPEKDTSFDLFSVQRDILSEPSFSSRQEVPEQKPADHASRYVPLRDFEKKPAVSAPSASDSYSRFPYNRPSENKGAAFLAFGKEFLEKTGELVRIVLDPKQVALRRVFYWGAAVLVVFFLFWGVNALNSQREDAMRSRYKIPGEPAPVKTQDAVPVVAAPIKSAPERAVVITPAPVRTSKVASVAAELYVIQVVTYPSAQDADSIVKTLKGAGFRAFVKENVRPSGRVFYLVLIGGFRTAADAQSHLLKFRGHEVARPFQDAFVRTNRS